MPKIIYRYDPENPFCCDCNQSKPLAQFVIKKNGKPYSYCNECNARRARESHRLKRGDKFRKYLPPASNGMKICRCCKETKPVSEFNKARTRDGYDGRCRTCISEQRPDVYLRRNYGIYKVQYDQMLADQEGLCAICRKKEATIHLGKELRLSVDHDHATNVVRGLLCYACNHFVGYLQRFGPEGLQAALAYLDHYGHWPTS